MHFSLLQVDCKNATQQLSLPNWPVWVHSAWKSLQEHKTHSQVKMSSLKCWVSKSAAQICTKLSDTQLRDLSSILAICPEVVNKSVSEW